MEADVWSIKITRTITITQTFGMNTYLHWGEKGRVLMTSEEARQYELNAPFDEKILSFKDELDSLPEDQIDLVEVVEIVRP